MLIGNDVHARLRRLRDRTERQLQDVLEFLGVHVWCLRLSEAETRTVKSVRVQFQHEKEPPRDLARLELSPAGRTVPGMVEVFLEDTRSHREEIQIAIKLKYGGERSGNTQSVNTGPIASPFSRDNPFSTTSGPQIDLEPSEVHGQYTMLEMSGVTKERLFFVLDRLTPEEAKTGAPAGGR